MGKIIFFLALSSVLIVSCSESTIDAERTEAIIIETSNDTLKALEYDSLYAAKLGADDYGMRKYVMAFLKKGPNRDQDDSTKAVLQRAHLDNITRLAEEGTLVLAGPFFDDGDIRGIYVFAVDSLSKAEELTKTDPAVKAGSLIMELHEWYGSAAVMEINEIHKRIAKIKI